MRQSVAFAAFAALAGAAIPLFDRTVESDWTVIVLSNYDPGPAGDLALSICEFVAAR